jgi:hypothetical protein
MTATARFKQLLFIVAGLALVGLGLTSLTTAAQADDSTGCIPTEDTLSAWADDGAPFTVHDDPTPPADPDGTDEASTTNLVRYVLVGTSKHVTQEAVEEIPATPSQWWNFAPNDQQGTFTGPPAFPTDPAGTWEGPHTVGGPGPNETGTFQVGVGNASWFHREPGTPGTPGQEEVSHTDYTWQKQTRTFTEGVDCPPAPEVCPEDTDKAGEVIPEGETAEEFCDDDNDNEKDVCPDGTDNQGQTIPNGETEESFCNDEPIIGPGGGGENPGPGNNPGNGSNHNPPGTNPSNNPGSNPQGSNQPNNGVKPVRAPGAQVPSAVDAGLAPTPRDLTGTGGGLNLLGFGTALIGAMLVGAAFRPRRRIQAGSGTGA